jgi:hypothetical protein
MAIKIARMKSSVTRVNGIPRSAEMSKSGPSALGFNAHEAIESGCIKAIPGARVDIYPPAA